MTLLGLTAVFAWVTFVAFCMNKLIYGGWTKWPLVRRNGQWRLRDWRIDG